MDVVATDHTCDIQIWRKPLHLCVGDKTSIHTVGLRLFDLTFVGFHPLISERDKQAPGSL